MAICLLAACLAQPVWGQGGDDPSPPPSSPTTGPWRIQEVNFKGFDNISPSQAQEVMETKSPRAFQLKAAPIFNFLAMRRDEKRLVKLYEEYGFFQATVTSEVKRLAQSRTVIVTFEAHENDPTKIKEVQLVFPQPRHPTAVGAKAAPGNHPKAGPALCSVRLSRGQNPVESDPKR